MKQFRPISLCDVIYKLITKVLVNRLQPFLDSLIGPLQCSFVPGRGTSDNALIAQKIMHFMHSSKSKQGSLAAKIDLEKAYDRVEWDFLQATLMEFDFPDITVRLIMFCIRSTNLTLLWNGSKLPSFAPARGLCQGDPLSPYLFVICMEKLSCLIAEMVEDNKWKLIHVSREGPCISHLFFIDDILLFTQATTSHARLVNKA